MIYGRCRYCGKAIRRAMSDANGWEHADEHPADPMPLPEPSDDVIRAEPD